MWNRLSGPSGAPVVDSAASVLGSRLRSASLPWNRRQPVAVDARKSGLSARLNAMWASPSGDLSSNLLSSSLPFLISTAATSESTLTLPKSMPPPPWSRNSCWRALLVVSLSLDLPSPTVQPDGHANSKLPSALGQLGPALPGALGSVLASVLA